MNKTFKLYEQRGRLDSELLCEFVFQGKPQTGDKVDLSEIDAGTVVLTRRWTAEGELVLDIQRQGVVRCQLEKEKI